MKAALLLLGAFAFAYNAATALHELGHALAAWAGGGSVNAWVLHPFSDSWVDVSPDPHPRATLVGGLVLGPLVGALLLAATRGAQGALALLAQLTAVAAFGTTSIYLTIGVLAGVGDAADLVALGVPRGLLLLGAGLLALGAAGFAPGALRLLGFVPEDPTGRRLLVVELGIAPYLAALLIYQRLHAPEDLAIWSAFAAAGLGLAALAVLGARVLERRAVPPLPKLEPTWSGVFAALVFGAGVVTAELLAV